MKSSLEPVSEFPPGWGRLLKGLLQSCPPPLAWLEGELVSARWAPEGETAAATRSTPPLHAAIQETHAGIVEAAVERSAV